MAAIGGMSGRTDLVLGVRGAEGTRLLLMTIGPMESRRGFLRRGQGRWVV